MLPYLRSEIHRLRHRRMTLVLTVLMALVPILIYTVIYLSVQAQLDALRTGRLQPPAGQPPVTEQSVRAVLTGLRPDRAPEFALGASSVVGTIFIAILAGSAMGNEFGWSTVRTVLAHGGRRGAFVFGKLGALLVALLVFIAVVFTATFLASYVLAAVAALDMTLSGDLPLRVIGYMARAAVVALPYLAFAVMVAVLARSAAAGIAFSLVLFFLESLLAQLAIQLNPDLRPFFDAGITRNVSTITRTLGEGPGPSTPLPSTVQFAFAAGILALYVIAFVSLAVHRFAKRDLTLA